MTTVVRFDIVMGRSSLAGRRSRQNPLSSQYSRNPDSLGTGIKDELKAVQLHLVATVDDFNPETRKAGVLNNNAGTELE